MINIDFFIYLSVLFLINFEIIYGKIALINKFIIKNNERVVYSSLYMVEKMRVGI